MNKTVIGEIPGLWNKSPTNGKRILKKAPARQNKSNRSVMTAAMVTHFDLGRLFSISSAAQQ
ncbi:MAG TPA: hypothetical protein VH255_07495 [Verrucomicrobiae bacterium]|nr:hypothetical protein [Verrucomicrobiae bacterium]